MYIAIEIKIDNINFNKKKKHIYIYTRACIYSAQNIYTITKIMSSVVSVASLSGIYIYPVKSLPGILLGKACITKNGIVHPDNFQVVDRLKIIRNLD